MPLYFVTLPTYIVVVAGPEHVGELGHFLHLRADLLPGMPFFPDETVRRSLPTNAIHPLMLAKQPINTTSHYTALNSLLI